ncbi:MAG: hypothetical protein MUF05_04515 [Candidatus Omnitrophica bacterium]|jgi:hexokinase|nr:hypothetical protein [Candidatus Omnitrophota bacterium]
MSIKVSDFLYRVSNTYFIQYLQEIFDIDLDEMREIQKDFLSQMKRGLQGKESPLKMLVTYAHMPDGNERGSFIALDLGGTNLRILLVELQGAGKVRMVKEKRVTIHKRHTRGKAAKLFGFIARSIEDFMRECRIKPYMKINIGFTFSFPVKQLAINRGKLMHWTKDFAITEEEGLDVVELLNCALTKRNLHNLKVAALLNDTVGTLVTRGYSEHDCDAGMILGTGTNACYIEKPSNITKAHIKGLKKKGMIVNIEWGNFDKLRLTEYDRAIDKESGNIGMQLLEKTVSGKYLGEIVRVTLKDLARRKFIFSLYPQSRPFDKPGTFNAEYLSRIEADSSSDLKQVASVFKEIGAAPTVLAERRLVKNTCGIISRRAARIIASVLTAVIFKMDPYFLKRHVVAVDGSLYEKHPFFSAHILEAMRELLGKRADKITLELTKDGSGKGAAIVAAISTG